MKCVWSVLAMGLIGVATAAGAEPVVSLESLVAEAIDRDAMPRL